MVVLFSVIPIFSINVQCIMYDAKVFLEGNAFTFVVFQNSIGVYRKNAIALQNESGDSNGGDV